MRTLFENEIKAIIEDLGEEEAIMLHNEYCQENNMMDDYVHHNMEIDEEAKLRNLTPLEIIEEYKDVYQCDYYYYNGYGNAVECDIDALMDICNIVETMLDDSTHYDCSELEEIVSLYCNLDDIISDCEELNVENNLNIDTIKENIMNYTVYEDLGFIENLATKILEEF